MRKAIIFDVGGVLLDYERAGMLEQIALLCQASVGADEIAKLIGEMDLSAGHETLEDFRTQLEVRYGFAASYDQLTRIWVQGLNARAWVAPLLQRLSEQADLHILSDTNLEHWSHIVDSILPIGLFDGVYVSHELKMTKKERHVFDHVLADIPQAASQCLFVDDTLANVEVAQRTGLRTHHYTDRHEMLGAIEGHLGG